VAIASTLYREHILPPFVNNFTYNHNKRKCDILARTRKAAIKDILKWVCEHQFKDNYKVIFNLIPVIRKVKNIKNLSENTLFWLKMYFILRN